MNKFINDLPDWAPYAIVGFILTLLIGAIADLIRVMRTLPHPRQHAGENGGEGFGAAHASLDNAEVL